MHQQQDKLRKMAQDISTSRSMAITRKVSSGIEITETRGDEDVFLCSLISKVRHVGEV